MKKIILLILVFCLGGTLLACSAKKMNTEKIRDIEFTVLEEEDTPEELLGTIQEQEETPFHVTYADKGYLYIAKGYGAQKTTGYSIKVKACYETANAIYMETDLIGPSKDEEIVEEKSCPYVVIKMEFIDKNVVFQ